MDAVAGGWRAGGGRRAVKAGPGSYSSPLLLSNTYWKGGPDQWVHIATLIVSVRKVSLTSKGELIRVGGTTL